MDDGRVWLITGASSGFGLAIAEAALERGNRVVATSRRGSIEGVDHGEHLELVPLDVTDADQRAAAADAAIERFGRIDVLVNAAGRTQSVRSRRPRTRSFAICSSFTSSPRSS